ncbi:MAG: DUF3786 domain-containing protein [Oscillospiraceae bacterium]|nr:DUF3786 domain-containing protein [Oscillospiraceae bacterium]
MKKADNYEIQMRQAQRRFLTYDREAIMAKCQVAGDGEYLYPVMLGRTYRLCCRTGSLEVQQGDSWQDANRFSEVMTILDWLCDCKPDRCLAGRFTGIQNFGHQFHQSLVEDGEDPTAAKFDRDPAAFHRACKALGGAPLSGCDMGYAIELFEGLPIGVKFWHSDEEFPAQIRWFLDENALQYLRYETMYYAVGLVKSLLLEKAVLY